MTEAEYEGVQAMTHQATDTASAALLKLVRELQEHAREHGWQDYDEPIANLLAFDLSALASLPAPAAPSGETWAIERTPEDRFDAIGPWSRICVPCKGHGFSCHECGGYGRIGCPHPSAPAAPEEEK